MIVARKMLCANLIRLLPRWPPVQALLHAHGQAPADAPPSKVTCTCGPHGRRALRQNGSQRHRIRDHGGICRGMNILRNANAGKTLAGGRRRDRANART